MYLLVMSDLQKARSWSTAADGICTYVHVYTRHNFRCNSRTIRMSVSVRVISPRAAKEVKCRDDIMPKTVDTRKYTARRIESMQQSSATQSLPFTVLSCIYSYWHDVITTFYFIFHDFYTWYYNSMYSSYTVSKGKAGTNVRLLCTKVCHITQFQQV